jgi:nucleotide-binding universal stress UspA family protein
VQINKILVPIDFSRSSRWALGHALILARQFGAGLELLHIAKSSPNALFPSKAAELQMQDYSQSKELLSALVKKEDRNGLDIQYEVKTGDVQVHILSTIRDEHIDIAVMGFHRRGIVGSWLAGSLAESILKTTDVPVLMVGQPARRHAINRILLATDLSESGTALTNYGFELARKTNADLLAVHAVEVGVEGGAEAAVYLGRPRLEEARERMNSLEQEAGRENVDFESVVVESAAADAIYQSAANRPVDLIVIGIQRNHLTGDNVIGTTAERVIHEAPVAVLTVPQPSELSRSAPQDQAA